MNAKRQIRFTLEGKIDLLFNTGVMEKRLATSLPNMDSSAALIPVLSIAPRNLKLITLVGIVSISKI